MDQIIKMETSQMLRIIKSMEHHLNYLQAVITLQRFYRRRLFLIKQEHFHYSVSLLQGFFRNRYQMGSKKEARTKGKASITL